MEYKSQLVVRSRDRQGSEIINRVKELADLEGKTYSEMALEIIGRGLRRGARADEPVESAAEEASESAPPPKPKKKKKKKKRKRKSSLEPGASPDEVVNLAVDAWEANGAQEAAFLLADFYAEATAADGGKVRDDLQGRLTNDDYDAIMEELKQTVEYRDYRDRVIFGT